MNTLESLFVLAIVVTAGQFLWLELTWNRTPKRRK